MNTLYKTTLLITMAVVTWKVWKIERNTRKPVINRNDFSKESTAETIERHSDPDSGIKRTFPNSKKKVSLVLK